MLRPKNKVVESEGEKQLHIAHQHPVRCRQEEIFK